MDRRLANELDNYITGHYGEDDPALKSDDEAPATAPPWQVDEEANVCAENRVILSPPAGFPSWGEAFANAELAAAAPAMLEALRRAADMLTGAAGNLKLGGYHDTAGQIDEEATRIRATIAKLAVFTNERKQHGEPSEP